MDFDPLAPLPLVTAELPGIGGTIKEFPEDFEVEEIPAYEPSGSGDYLYLWVEKRAMGAEYFVRQIARRLGIANNDVGTAGLKDRQAVTRQMVSIPDVGTEKLAQLDGDGMRVLRVSRHGNKLRPGHLRGNRFRILIRRPDPEAPGRLSPILAKLGETGVPNFYGPQRFGKGGETVRMGLAMLGGDKASENAGGGRSTLRRNPFLRKFALSAAQSALFNDYLARRMQEGLFRQVIDGDVMARWPFGGIFTAEDLGTEQSRFDRRETVHTGPIYGRKMYAAGNIAAERENFILLQAGLTRDAFTRFGKLLQGTRRHNLFYLSELAAVAEPEGVRVSFTLPAGSYATIVLSEVMKCTKVDSEEDAS
jgi:tRNA pseudouridine13 synthase